MTSLPDARAPLAVAAGVIVRNRRILLARRLPDGPHGGLWEFPGGKLEPGEAPDRALARELFEELGVRVRVGRPLPEVLWPYSHLVLRLIPFWCRLPRDAEPHPLGCAEIFWAEPAALAGYPMPDADLPVARLVARSARRGS